MRFKNPFNLKSLEDPIKLTQKPAPNSILAKGTVSNPSKVAKLTNSIMSKQIMKNLGNASVGLKSANIQTSHMNPIYSGKWATTANPGSEEDYHKNMELLKRIECIQNADTDDWNLVVSFTIKIGGDQVYRAEKKKLSEGLKKKIDILIDKIDQALKNKKTLIDLLS